MVLRFRPEVYGDLQDARDWYEARRLGLGDEFVIAVNQVLIRVDAVPKQFPIVHTEVRRALLRRFPYAIFFIDDQQERLVLAVLHQAVSPHRWPGRS